MKSQLFPALISVFFNYSCTNDNSSTTTNVDSTQVNIPVQTDTVAKNYTSSPDTSLYAIVLPSDTLHLAQWDSTINLSQQLGQPVKQKTRELGSTSDTFAGSFIKDMQFDGVSLQLFSPKQNGKTFWVQEIILTSNKYKTTRGTTIGDELEKVKSAYPSLENFPGNTKNMYHVSDDGYEKSIEMEFENNKLKKLRMYYMLN